MPNNKGSKWKTSGVLKTPNLVKHYKSTVKENVLSETMFRKVINACNEEVVRLIVEEGKEMRIPYLSTLEVRKSLKPKCTGVNYKHLNETGEVTYYENEHSDGYRARIHWKKKAFPIVGAGAYSFNPVRAFSRGVSAEMSKFKGHNKYSEYARKSY